MFRLRSRVPKEAGRRSCPEGRALGITKARERPADAATPFRTAGIPFTAREYRGRGRDWRCRITHGARAVDEASPRAAGRFRAYEVLRPLDAAGCGSRQAAVQEQRNGNGQEDRQHLATILQRLDGPVQNCRPAFEDYVEHIHSHAEKHEQCEYNAENAAELSGFRIALPEAP